MKAIKINNLIGNIEATVKNHDLGNGEFCRYLWQNETNTRKMGNNEYGCADAANILYTIGKFERNLSKRAKMVQTLQNFQHEDGLFDEGTHHPIHCTAHCTAALELFDSAPRLPLYDLMPYKHKDDLYALLDNVSSEKVDPWGSSHQGAGIFAAFILTGNASPEWQSWYFNYLQDHADKKFGLGFDGTVDNSKFKLANHLNGWFHYVFNMCFAKQPIPYADKVVDTCIELYNSKTQLTTNFGQMIGFAEIDWVYVIHRAMCQSGHRTMEVKKVLADFAQDYLSYLNNIDWKTHDQWNDLHMLFGCLCALAELQSALPGTIQTDYPLRLVLDRRPFI